MFGAGGGNMRITDDRGSPRDIVMSQDLLASLSRRQRWGLFFGGFVLPLVVLALGWWTGESCFLFLGAAILAAVAYRRFFRSSRPDLLALASASLMSGRCGACGYSLAEFAPEEDSCRVCPECGAAWKQERTTTSASDEAAFRRNYARIRRRLDRLNSKKNWDHRRTPAPVLAHNSPILSALTDDGERRRATAVLKALKARTMQLRLLALGVGPVLAMLLLTPLLIAGSYTGDDVGFLIVLGIPLLALVVLVPCSLGVSPRSRARTCLGQGLCATCAGPLAGLEPESDGCVRCPRCGSAWRKNAIGALPSLESLAEAPRPSEPMPAASDEPAF